MSQLDREQTKKSKAELTTELATVVANAARSATPGFVRKVCHVAGSPASVVDITDKGVLTGITVVFQPTDAVENVAIALTVAIDGSNVINNTYIASKPDVATTAMQLATTLPFYHPFDTSLAITATVIDPSLTSTGIVFVTYTTD
jgi:hypothetical protein